jgi:FlaG/FlaF family flagellin (archaellin)
MLWYPLKSFFGVRKRPPQLVSGEALIAPTCVLKTATDHNIGEEASQVQVSLSETCQAGAYNTNDLQQMVSHLVSQEAQQRYGTGYTLAGDINVNLQNTVLTMTNNQQIATMNVNAVSQWVYQFGKRQQQQISNHIAGKGRGEALHMLSRTEGIQQATVALAGGYNDTLPSDAGRIQIVIVYRFV